MLRNANELAAESNDAQQEMVDKIVERLMPNSAELVVGEAPEFKLSDEDVERIADRVADKLRPMLKKLGTAARAENAD
jgi:hypothetical protein